MTAKLREATHEAEKKGGKNVDEKARKARESTMHMLLHPGEEQDAKVGTEIFEKKKAKPKITEEEDPLVKEARELGISEETLRATVSFKNRQFKDPAPLFKKGQGGGTKRVTG